ncbi:MAG: hypothetical protein ACRC20_00565 [Segniliparus sp.]|uniref:hypothetical protein n=1 Tax=Segniliparus sp. TaxID=2804064 RepID=UPI003F301BCE
MGKKVSATLTDAQLEIIERAVSEGAAKSVAAFVAAAVAEKCGAVSRQDAHGDGEDPLESLLREMDEEYGPPSPEAEAWAEEQIARLLGRAQSA